MKVFSFAFLNSFGRLFYKSIISPDSDELNIMSITFTIVWAVIHLVRFTLFPLIKYKIIKYFLDKNYELYASGKWRKMYTS
jgi:anoctamin-10